MNVRARPGTRAGDRRAAPRPATSPPFASSTSRTSPPSSASCTGGSPPATSTTSWPRRSAARSNACRSTSGAACRSAPGCSASRSTSSSGGHARSRRPSWSPLTRHHRRSAGPRRPRCGASKPTGCSLPRAPARRPTQRPRAALPRRPLGRGNRRGAVVDGGGGTRAHVPHAAPRAAAARRPGHGRGRLITVRVGLVLEIVGGHAEVPLLVEVDPSVETSELVDAFAQQTELASSPRPVCTIVRSGTMFDRCPTVGDLQLRHGDRVRIGVARSADAPRPAAAPHRGTCSWSAGPPPAPATRSRPGRTSSDATLAPTSRCATRTRRAATRGSTSPTTASPSTTSTRPTAPSSRAAGSTHRRPWTVTRSSKSATRCCASQREHTRGARRASLPGRATPLQPATTRRATAPTADLRVPRRARTRREGAAAARRIGGAHRDGRRNVRA